MANVLLVFGYKVNLVITCGLEHTALKQLKHIDTHLIDAVDALLLTDNTFTNKGLINTAETTPKPHPVPNQHTANLAMAAKLTHITTTHITTRDWPQHALFSHTTLQF